MLPIVGFVAGGHPLMLATVEAVRADLTPLDAAVDGLLYRYRPTHPGSRDDGLEGTEAALAIASFWLVEALALAGRAGEAEKLFEGFVGLGGRLDQGSAAPGRIPTTPNRYQVIE